jgi:uncharacterized protein (TIGR03086 family)
MTQPAPGSAEIVARACASTAAVLATVDAADFGRATPCKSWTVKDVVDHIIDSAATYAELAETGAWPTDGEDYDRTAGDFRATFDRAAARLVAAFSAPAAMDKVMALPFGGMPGSICVWLAAGDMFLHGWDLAKATGQPTDLEPELAAQLLPPIEKLLPDTMRGPDGQAPFGPKVEAPASAPAADRLAAFTGRQP